MSNILGKLLIVLPLLIIGLLLYILFYKKNKNQSVSVVRILLIIFIPISLVLFWWLFFIYAFQGDNVLSGHSDILM
jgi:hypothetical protein